MTLPAAILVDDVDSCSHDTVRFSSWISGHSHTTACAIVARSIRGICMPGGESWRLHRCTLLCLTLLAVFRLQLHFPRKCIATWPPALLSARRSFFVYFRRASTSWGSRATFPFH